jgi:predicted nucleic acid-binding protein
VAIRHGVAVLHKDADYESIASVSPLEEESLR